MNGASIIKRATGVALFTAMAIMIFATPVLPTDAAATPPDPLTVQVASFDGKKRLGVARTISVYASCSKQCNADATVTLRTPAGDQSFTEQRVLGANSFLTLGITVSRFGREYLRENLDRSRFIVSFAGTDVRSGEKDQMVRSFRLSK